MSEGVAGPVAAEAAGWDERLAAFRIVGDPEVDRAIADYCSRHRDQADLRRLVHDVINDLDRVKVNRDWCPEPLRSLAWEPPDLPGWAHDHDLIERGQAVFHERGLEMGAALVFAALPMAYAAVHGAEALSRVSDFATHHLTRRVAETGQMLIDVMGTSDSDCLEPGGQGYATAIGLRLLHGCVRALLTDESDRWPDRKLGVPLNQEIMVATLMDFTLVTWEAMERMGEDLSTEDRRAHLYTWSVIGALMGLDACQPGPLSVADAAEIGAALDTQLGETAGGRRLMAALLSEMERLMPLGLRKLPRSLVHWLFAAAPAPVRDVPDMLAVPPAAWWSGPAFSALRAANGVRLPRLLRRPVERLTRRAGRLVFTGFIDGHMSEAPLFRIPPELEQAWGLRTGKASKGVRNVRHRARQRTRALVWRGDGRSGQ